MLSRKGALVLLSVVVLALTAPSGVVAQDGPDVSLVVDGESVSDGETVEVGETAEIQVTVSSETTLDYVTTEYNGSFRSEGVRDENTFNLTREIDVFLGQTRYRVTAANENGDTTSFAVTLNRPPRGGSQYQQVIDRLDDRVDRLNDSNQNLRERSRNLSSQNDELQNETQRLRQRLDELNGSDGGSGLPGFGPAAALVALALAVAAVGIRRKL